MKKYILVLAMVLNGLCNAHASKSVTSRRPNLSSAVIIDSGIFAYIAHVNGEVADEYNAYLHEPSGAEHTVIVRQTNKGERQYAHIDINAYLWQINSKLRANPEVSPYVIREFTELNKTKRTDDEVIEKLIEIKKRINCRDNIIL